MKAEFRGEDEVYEVELLPDLHGKGWRNRLRCRGKSSGREYVLSQRNTTLEWCCSCAAWRFFKRTEPCYLCVDKALPGHRECKHLEAIGLTHVQGKDNPPVAIINVIGELRWYAQQAKRFKEVNVIT